MNIIGGPPDPEGIPGIEGSAWFVICPVCETPHSARKSRKDSGQGRDAL